MRVPYSRHGEAISHRIALVAIVSAARKRGRIVPSDRASYDPDSTPRGKLRLPLALAALALSVLVAGFVVLGLIDMAPQPQSVEKVISNDRLSR